MKIFFKIALLFVLAVCFTGCSKDNKDLQKLYCSYDGVEVPIETVAYSVQEGGYNIVFSPQVVTFTPAFKDDSKDLFCIDIPIERIGHELSFPGNMHDIDGADWVFYLSHWNSVSRTQIFHLYDNIASGTVLVSISTDGTFLIKLNVVDENGKRWKIEYEGKPTKLNNYIWNSFN
jgi:hypothetical protein